MNWIDTKSENKPIRGEHVLVITANADDDPIAVTACYNGERKGKPYYLATGGREVKPCTHWCAIPDYPLNWKPK